MVIGTRELEGVRSADHAVSGAGAPGDGPATLLAQVAPVISREAAEAIRAAAEGTCGIVTLEEHTVLGGFGSAVLEGFALRGWRTPIRPLGLEDAATHIIGEQEWIRERAGLSTDHVRETVRRFARSNA